MRAIAIKMKSYAGSMKGIESGMEGPILHFLIFSIGALGLLYVFLLGSMVFNIISRKSYENEAKVLVTQVGEMELEYFSMSEKVDLSLSHSLGFKEIKPTYVSRKATSSVGALNPSSSSVVKRTKDEI